MVKIVKKADIFLIALFILLSISLIFMFVFLEARVYAGNTVVYIFVDREVYKTASLSELEGNIKITQTNGHVNTILFENNSARMICASCIDQICLHRGVLSSAFQPPIVCLPNRVVVEFRQANPDQNQFDLIIGKNETT